MRRGNGRRGRWFLAVLVGIAAGSLVTAQQEMDGKTLDGRSIVVNVAQDRRDGGGQRCTAGFLAQVRPENVERVGNAALRGAAMLLLSRRRREALSDIIGRIEHVELETEPDFFDLFVDGCLFHPIPSISA